MSGAGRNPRALAGRRGDRIVRDNLGADGVESLRLNVPACISRSAFVRGTIHRLDLATTAANMTIGLFRFLSRYNSFCN